MQLEPAELEPTQLNRQIAQLIAQQNSLLQQLVEVLQQKQPLGFGMAPRPKYIYCNRSQGGLWYTLSEAVDRTPQPIPQTALTCLVERLEFKQVERRGKETWKTHLHVKADRHYILEAGYDSNFSRSLLSSLATMTPEQLQQPITIEVQAGSPDEVLFCRVYADGEPIFAPWDDQSDWRKIARRAIAVVEEAHRKTALVA